MAEAGYPDVDIHLFSGVFAPAATPAAIVAKLETGLNEAISDPGVSEKLRAMAVEPAGRRHGVGRFQAHDRGRHRQI